MTDLDSILSGKGAAAPTPEAVAEPNTEQQTTQVESEAQGAEAEGNGEQGGRQKMVPQEALHAEKQKVKRYTEQVADFDRKLGEQNSAWERRFEQLIGALQPQQKPQEQQQATPDFWVNPTEFVSSALTPVQQQIKQQQEAFSLTLAEDKHGAETVANAFNALKAAMQTNPAAAGEYQAIMQSRHPYGALVDWHKKHEAAQEIGSDPAAYREKLKAEILAEMQAASPASAPTPVMPSNLAGARNVGSRSGPA